MSIHWIASYPKSGSTWVRFFLYAYSQGPITSSLAVNDSIPDLHRNPNLNLPRPLLIKTHFALSPSHPLIDQTDRAIYVVRNPRDILYSAYRFLRLTNDQVDQLTYAKAFINFRGDPAWKHMGFGSWHEHTNSWLDQKRFKVHLVQYEDLHSTPEKTFSDILRFLDIKIDPDKLKNAIHHASFDSMKQLETREKSSDKPSLFRGSQQQLNQGIRFVNSGLTGQSLNTITPGLEQSFKDAFSNALTRFNY